MTADNPNTISRTREPIDQVYAWILEGASEHEIIQAAAELWPDVKARPLITAAMKRIAPASGIDADRLAGWCIEATRLVYQRAIESNDLASALRAVKQVCEIRRRTGAADGEESTAEEAIRAHLSPLKLSNDPHASTTELARLAVAKLIARSTCKQEGA